jgi:hypothetical protein
MARPLVLASCLIPAVLAGLACPREGAAQARVRPNIRQQAPALPAYMRLRVEADLVTAEIQNTPLPRVLEEFAARSGIVFEIAIQDETPVSVSFYRISLHEAVERLVAGYNSMFYYSPDAAGKSRINLVRIFSRDEKPKQASLRYIGTGSVTRSGDDTIDTPDQALKALAESDDVDLREKSVEFLVVSGGEPAIQAITAALDDKSPEVKVAAIEGLAGMGVRNALPQILKALKDPHPGVRHSAITAIALLGDVENLKDLRPMGQDKDASVAEAAETAIRKLSLRHP